MTPFCYIVIFSIGLIPREIGAKKISKSTYERSILEYYDPEIVSNASVFVDKYNRSSDYTFNFNATFLKPLGKSSMISAISYELLSNQYKMGLFFFNVSMCQFLASDAFSRIFAQHSNMVGACPLLGHYYVKNHVYDGQEIWGTFPDSRYRVEMNIWDKATNKSIMAFTNFVMFKRTQFHVQTKNQKKRNRLART